MKGFIYKITDKVNGKSYIGQTRMSIEFRWRQHKNSKVEDWFHRTIRKYGPDRFTVETLEECDVNKLNEREMFYIAKYNTFKNGYNLTIGGDGNRRLTFTDNQYEEIKELYLSGFSSNKIAELFNIDKSTVVKLLEGMGVKIRRNNLKFNNQELQEIIKDYESGCSLKSLAKRYDCTAPGLSHYLKKKGVDLRKKYSIMENKEDLQKMINAYLDNNTTLKLIMHDFHCDYNTFARVLSNNGVSRGKKHFKLSEKEMLEIIKLYNEGKDIKWLADKFEVHKDTIKALLKRYNNYPTV